MFLTFRFDSLIIHSAGGDGLVKFGKGFGGLAEGRWLALLLIKSRQSEAAGKGTLQSGTVAGMPVGQQIDTAARPPHPQQLEREAESVMTVLSQPYAKAHLQRIASAIALRLQLDFRQREVVHSQIERSAADGS